MAELHPEQFLSARSRSVDASGIRKVFDLGAKLQDPINFSIGQPDFDVPVSIRQAAVDAMQAGRNGYTVTQGIAPLREHYDYIIIDCPPALGLLTINALTAAQSVLIPVQCEYYALEGLTQLLNTLRLVRENINPDLEIEGILLTMHDSRNNLSRQVEEDIRGHFKDLVYTTNIPRNVSLSEAPSFGKPIIMYDIRSKGAQSYLSLAREVLEHV